MAAIINLPSSPKISAPAEQAQQPLVANSAQNEDFSQALSQQVEKKQAGMAKQTESVDSQGSSGNTDVKQQVKPESSEAGRSKTSAGEAAQAEPETSSSAESSQSAVVPVELINTDVQQPSLQELLGLSLGSGNVEGGKDLPLMAKLVQGASIAEVMASRNSRATLTGPNAHSTDKVAVSAQNEHALLALQQRVQQQLAQVNNSDASVGEIKLALQGVENALQSLNRLKGDHAELKGLEQAREQLLTRLQGLQGQNAQSGGGSSAEQQGSASKFTPMPNMTSEDGGKLPELTKLTRAAFQEMMAQQQLTNGQTQAGGLGGLMSGPSISMSSLSAMLSPTGGTNPLLNYATSSGSLNVPVNHPAWGQAVGERLQWMVKQDIQQAELKLNPRNMGPIEIKISMNQEQANVSFVANHAMTREALDAAIPRLREMFGESGLNLVDVNVSQNPDTSGQRASERGDESTAGRNKNLAAESTEDEPSQAQTINSLDRQNWYGANSVLDAYA